MAMTAREHNNLLGIFVMIRGGLLAFGGIIMAICLAVGGMALMSAAHVHDDRVGGGIMMVGGIVGGILLVLFGFLDLFTGIQIRKVNPIGRTLGIIISALMLLSFPLGTALGIYGLWFLLGDMGKALYTGSEAPAGNYDPPSAPPPNSWA